MGKAATSEKTRLDATMEAPMPVLPAWAAETGWDSDVVLSTRARLARNLRGNAFPNRASNAELKQVACQVINAAKKREKGQIGLRAVEISGLSASDKAVLIDSHLISVGLARAGQHRWALVDDRQTVSVMVNEEDHLRLQVILPGSQLDAAWRIADLMDDQFGEHLAYAFDPSSGYLTSSLTNCGTGLRLSVMAHLPGLAVSHQLVGTLDAARTLGSVVRGFYGEGIEAAGNVYQISNAVSTGKSERQLLTRLAATASLLVTDEQAARELLWRRERLKIEGLVEAAETRLKEAERLPTADSMDILSLLRLGAILGLPTGVTSRVFNELLSSLHLGVQFVSGEKAQFTFYEETRRPALIRNKIREQKLK